MKIPFSYTFRSLWTRRLTTTMTITGVALVVFVFAAVLMLAYGVEKTMVETGYEDNVICLRKASQGELASQIDRDAISNIKTYPEIKLSKVGKPLASNELFTIINLNKIETNDMGNVAIRGVSPEAFELRPLVKIIEGSIFNLGINEVIIGTNLQKRFVGCNLGNKLTFGGEEWKIVGIFEASGTGFESEVWGDVNRFMTAFDRGNVFSALTFQLNNKEDFIKIQKRVEEDPRFNYVELKLEKVYYREQSEIMAGFIRILGTTITIIFSFGAMIGAMITMYSAVANRTIEVGTLRALGFRRRNILTAFLFESLTIAFIGAGVGLLFASFLQFFSLSTINWGTFTEFAFGFELSPDIIISSIVFAVVMGIVGGFLPAIRASRLNIVNALRAS